MKEQPVPGLPGVFIRRPFYVVAPARALSLCPAHTLQAEFHELRHRLLSADANERAVILARLNEIVRLRKAIDAHASFFHPDRRPLPDEVVH